MALKSHTQSMGVNPSSFDGLLDGLPIEAGNLFDGTNDIAIADFNMLLADPLTGNATCTTTGTGASTAIGLDSLLVIDGGTDADEGESVQKLFTTGGTPIWPSVFPRAGRDNCVTWIAFRLALGAGDAVWATTDGPKAYVGWNLIDTAIMAPTTGAMSTAPNSGYGFHLTELGVVNAYTKRGTTETETAIGTVAGIFGSDLSLAFDPQDGAAGASFVTLACKATSIDNSDNANNGMVEFFLNGVKVATHVNEVPDSTVLNPTIELINGASPTLGTAFGIDWILTAHTRRGLTL